MGLTPDFFITANARNITSLVRPRLINITVTDKAGIEADAVKIVLAGGELSALKPNAEISVALGYTDAAMVSCGTFFVDSITTDLKTQQRTLAAKAIPTNGRTSTMQDQRSASYDNVTLGNLVRTVAERHGLTASVTSFVDAIAISHVDQKNESDIHLLTRLGLNYGATIKAAGGHLVARLEREPNKPSGAAIPGATIRLADLIAGSHTQTVRESVQSVTADYVDPAGGTASITVGSGSPTHRLTYGYDTAAAAIAAATAKLKKSQSSDEKISVTLPGDASLIAERPVNVEGLGDRWVIDNATHTFSAKGFTTKLTLITREPASFFALS